MERLLEFFVAPNVGVGPLYLQQCAALHRCVCVCVCVCVCMTRGEATAAPTRCCRLMTSAPPSAPIQPSRRRWRRRRRRRRRRRSLRSPTSRVRRVACADSSRGASARASARIRCPTPSCAERARQHAAPPAAALTRSTRSPSLRRRTASVCVCVCVCVCVVTAACVRRARDAPRVQQLVVCAVGANPSFVLPRGCVKTRQRRRRRSVDACCCHQLQELARTAARLGLRARPWRLCFAARSAGVAHAHTHTHTHTHNSASSTQHSKRTC